MLQQVLFHTYDWAFQRPGGGEIQLSQTKRHLEALGVQVDLFDRWKTQLSEFPLVHSFSFNAPEFWEPVKLAGCVLGVSSIHWPFVPPDTLHQRLRRSAIAAGRRGLGLKSRPPWPPCHLVDIFFPNSQMEADLLCQAYGVPADKMHVVPNGVEERFIGATADAFVREYGLREFVLCVGRIDARKNQLRLLQALQGIDRPIVIIGEPVLGQEAYYDECRRAAGPGVHFIGKLDHASPLLESAYAAAAVLALPSYIETPGLCALEAGLAGTPLVVTEQGCTREYFGEDALYVNPSSLEEIRSAVLQQLSARSDPTRLRERICGRYLWRHAAQRTLLGYERAMTSARIFSERGAYDRRGVSGTAIG